MIQVDLASLNFSQSQNLTKSTSVTRVSWYNPDVFWIASKGGHGEKLCLVKVQGKLANQRLTYKKEVNFDHLKSGQQWDSNWRAHWELSKAFWMDKIWARMQKLWSIKVSSQGLTKKINDDIINLVTILMWKKKISP